MREASGVAYSRRWRLIAILGTSEGALTLEWGQERGRAVLLEVAFLRGSCIPDALKFLFVQQTIVSMGSIYAGEDAGLSALKGEEVTVKTPSPGQASGEPSSSVWGCGSCQEFIQPRDRSVSTGFASVKPSSPTLARSDSKEGCKHRPGRLVREVHSRCCNAH